MLDRTKWRIKLKGLMKMEDKTKWRINKMEDKTKWRIKLNKGLMKIVN